jgi:hypothetical protein
MEKNKKLKKSPSSVDTRQKNVVVKCFLRHSANLPRHRSYTHTHRIRPHSPPPTHVASLSVLPRTAACSRPPPPPCTGTNVGPRPSPPPSPPTCRRRFPSSAARLPLLPCVAASPSAADGPDVASRSSIAIQQRSARSKKLPANGGDGSRRPTR